MKQIQITSKAPKCERPELDLRKPSGRRLPY
jgi:hypothetical protein